MTFDSRAHLNRAGAFVAVALVTILAFVTWALVYHEVPDKNSNALLLVLGVLTANVGVIVGFFYGSSVANQKKDDTIKTLADTAKTAGAALPGGNGSDVLNVPEGQTATVEATDSGTVVKKD